MNSQDTQKSKLDSFFANPAIAIVMAVVCNFLWGCAFPFIKLGYSLFAVDGLADILTFAGIRFSMGGLLVLIAGSFIQRRALTFPKGGQSIIALALFQTALQYFFYYLAVANLTGARGSILNASSSFLGVIIAHFLYGNADKMTRLKALGCVVGFSGVLVATLVGGSTGSGGFGKGDIFMITATVVFAFSGPFNKAVTKKFDSFTVSGYNLLCGGIVLLALGLIMGGNLTVQGAAAIPVLLFLALISSVGYVLWALLMKNNPVSRISIFTVLIPVTTTILSAALLGENMFEFKYLAALALVCIGIALVNIRSKK